MSGPAPQTSQIEQQNPNAGEETQFIYIDESGHTGDLSRMGDDFTFRGQPHFVLAAVGPISPSLAEELLIEIREKHGLHQLKEFKSKKLGNRPAIARDLIIALRNRRIPIFVEAIDKRFYLIRYVMSCIVVPPPKNSLLDEHDWAMRNMLMDYLYKHLPPSVIQAFVSACNQDSQGGVRSALDELLRWARESVPDDFVNAVIAHTEYVIEELEEGSAEDPLAYREFLPVPERGKQRAVFWMLPHYSAFKNLYARINEHSEEELAKIRLVHDAQTQYDELLRRAKSAIERGDMSRSNYHQTSGRAFKERAELEYLRSDETAGLMIADVVGGHIRRELLRHVQDNRVQDEAFEGFLHVWESNDQVGTGLKLDIPSPDINKLKLLRSHWFEWLALVAGNASTEMGSSGD
ncbi:DUF3800 domain-containing protein [Stenotrophomonas maltophilia]|uniref:DUF3800 domain-containing protein n=1 Tax=Stenotrophomonas maltophilia TaxID=40324 RepID=UPI00066D302C|nr:DUF3800 domain-containing protein [Stenotrophomonas maltophilia]